MPEPEPPVSKETVRLEAFSDGVFAVAVTLLVLELKIPPHPVGGPTFAGLRADLLRQWPSYFAFATSFFTVLVMWVHHHAIFKCVRATDATLMYANGLLLMLVSSVPFATGVVAQYLMTPAAKMACYVYAGTFVVIAVSFYLLMLAAFRQCLLMPDASQAVLQRMRKSYRYGPMWYLIATISTAAGAWLCMAICTALWIFWAAETMHIARTDGGPESKG